MLKSINLFESLLDENTSKEVELLILHIAKKWTDKGLFANKKDLAEDMPDSLVAKLSSLNDITPVLKNLIQKDLVNPKGEGFVITPDGIFYLRKYLLTISIPENRQKVDEMIEGQISDSSKNLVSKFLDEVRDLPQDEKGRKIMDFLKANPIDIAMLLIRVGIMLTTGN